MMKKSTVSFISLGELFENKVFNIPAFQRNYVWDKNTVTTVVNNILEHHPLGMITLHHEKSEYGKDYYSVIDGQQRLITLWMLFHLLCPRKEPISLTFERDNKIQDGKTRRSFLESLSAESVSFSVDTARFQEAYVALGKCKWNGNEIANLNETDGELLATDIKKKVHIIEYISQADPHAEFLNLNKNKNPFSLADYSRTYLLLSLQNQKEEEVKEKKEKNILRLFSDLSSEFYKECQWKDLKRNYETNETNGEQPEYRLNLLFTDRYYVDGGKANNGENRENISCLLLPEKADKEINQLEWYDKAIKESFSSVPCLNGLRWWLSKDRKPQEDGKPQNFFALLNKHKACEQSFRDLLINEFGENDSFLQVQLEREPVEILEGLGKQDEVKYNGHIPIDGIFFLT